MNWKFWTWLKKDSETAKASKTEDVPPLLTLRPEDRVRVARGYEPRRPTNDWATVTNDEPLDPEITDAVEEARKRLAEVQARRLELMALNVQERRDLETVDRAEYEAFVAEHAEKKRAAIKARTAEREKNPNRPPRGIAGPRPGSREADLKNMRENRPPPFGVRVMRLPGEDFK